MNELCFYFPVGSVYYGAIFVVFGRHVCDGDGRMGVRARHQEKKPFRLENFIFRFLFYFQLLEFFGVSEMKTFMEI